MRHRAGLLLAAASLLAGCTEGGGYTDHGAGVATTTDLAAIGDILESPQTYAGQTVTVKGVIASVCPSAGCFLRLGAGTEQILVDLQKSGFNIPPGQGAGQVAFATGTVGTSAAETWIEATGVRILDP